MEKGKKAWKKIKLKQVHLKKNYCFRSSSTFSEQSRCTIISLGRQRFASTNKQLQEQLTWKLQAPNFRRTAVPDQRRGSHRNLAVCQELHLDFHLEVGSQEGAWSYL